MFLRTSIEMDIEFLDRMSQISKRVRVILEESEKMKELLAERITRRAEKAAEATEVVDDKPDLDVSEGEDDEEEEEDAEKPLDLPTEEEAEEDNDFSDCWTCLCGRRR